MKARRAGVLIVAAGAGALAMAAPAMADVSINPPSAAQTTGANLVFHVTNTGTSPMIKVQIALPADSAVAELYPLSVPDFAPEITQKQLATPLNTIHGGAPATASASAITWIAMPGKSIKPGASADLPVTLGPLPTTTSMDFLVTATYADGKPGPAIPPAVLALTPATAEQLAEAHAGHDTGDGTPTADPDAALFAQTVAQADNGPSWWSILGWVAAAALAAIAIVLIMRNRRRGAADGDDQDGDDQDGPDGDESAVPADAGAEPVAAGAKLRASSWRYQDSPDDN